MESDSDPLWFVNRCALESKLVDRVAFLLDSNTKPTARSIVELAVLAESYVLHDGLVVVGPDGIAISATSLKDASKSSSVSTLTGRGGIQDEDAERYTVAVLESAGISFDEFHPNYESLQDAWDEEDQERHQQPDTRSDIELDEYELRIREAERSESLDDSDAEFWDDWDYWDDLNFYNGYADPDEAVQRRAKQTGIPRLDEAATAMGLSIVQNPMDSLQSLARRVQQPVSVELYRKLADYYRVSIEQLLRFQGIRQAYIPPVLAIILDRCRTKRRGDIPRLLGDFREELGRFRGECTLLQRSLLQETTLAKQFEICAELDAVQAAFIKSVGKGHGRFVYQAWDIVKKGSALGILTTGVDRLIEHDAEVRIRQKWQAFFDIWRAATLVASHAGLINRVFGSDVADAPRLLEIASQTAALERELRSGSIE